MKVAICGTKGIPNNYGGFEQFAEYLGQNLVERGYSVSVYSPHFHTSKVKEYKGIKIIRKYNLSQYIGPVGNIIYDYFCLRNAAKTADVILMCGYSSSFLLKLFSSKIIVNMDGLEWQRQKWNKWVKKYLLFSEKLAVKYAKEIVVDNFELVKYYENKYKVSPTYIPYGADLIADSLEGNLDEFELKAKSYFLLVSRIEPENNIDMVINGFLLSKTNAELVIVGNKNNAYGKKLSQLYKHENIKFVGDIYDKSKLDFLRQNALSYIHGHSVGGTNPSLLEAMVAKIPIIAFDNVFNKYVLGKSLFFHDSESLSVILKEKSYNETEDNDYLKRINDEFNWTNCTQKYEAIFKPNR